MAQTPNLINLLSPYNIVIYMLVFTRLAGMIQTAPFFSSIQAPTMTKIWFSALVSFIFYPLVYASKTYIMPKDMAEFIILIIFEFLIGYLIGFVANMILEGVRMSGSIFSIQMGLSMSEALDPTTGVSSNEISRIYIYLATLIFLGTGAYQILFMALFGSFSGIPIGTFPFFDSQIVNSLLILFAQIFKIAFGVALPIFSVLLTCDILLGMMSKMMPQMNIYMVAIPVKIYIGLFLILAFLSATNVYLQGVIQNYMEALSRIFT
ncbi:flagellar biosynthetic protein FliR [bacterium]|nr:flagellar biosynthetic protein FliR [bacterium]MBQ9149812.1 flagellar biosynthetic protein FliR [bacterium]